MCKGHKNVAVLTCAKELHAFDRSDSAWLSSGHGMDVSLQSFRCLFRLYSGGILDSGPPIPDGVCACTWRLHDNDKVRAGANKEGGRSV